jgi:hypothetical protein
MMDEEDLDAFLADEDNAPSYDDADPY